MSNLATVESYFDGIWNLGLILQTVVLCSLVPFHFAKHEGIKERNKRKYFQTLTKQSKYVTQNLFNVAQLIRIFTKKFFSSAKILPLKVLNTTACLPLLSQEWF